MTGKVFSESANIYQDEAKVLFDYYKAAAEKIVAEEMAAEQDRNDLENARRGIAHKRKTGSILFPIMLGIGALCLIIGIVMLIRGSGLGILPLIFAVAGIVFGIKFLVDFVKASSMLADNQRLTDEVNLRFQNIRRDYRVDKIGVVYVPVASRVPFEDKSFLVDHTNGVGETDFHLTVLHQPEVFQESIQNLQDSMTSMPIVETDELPEEVNTSEYSVSLQNVTLHDYIGNIDRQMRNVSYLLNDSDEAAVSIPVIMPQSEQADFLRNYATSETNGNPVVTAFEVDFDDKLSKLSSLNALKDQLKNSDGSDSAEYMKRLMHKLAESVQILSKTRNSSSSKLIDYTSSILGNVLKASCTQYSPSLEAEEIERIRSANFDYQTSVNDYTPFSMKASSRVKYDMFSGNWVAEDGSRTSMPFGMHQVDEEVIMPVITALMEENRIERLRIYNNIEDQKREYLEKWSSETGNYFRDNRKSADELITHMREAYADYVSAYNMYKSLQDTSGTMKASGSLEDAEVKEVDSQAEVLAGFEMQAQQCNEQQERFREFMDRIQDNISESTNQFAHVEYYEGFLRDSVSHDTAVAMSEIHNLDERRRQLIKISPYAANFAELPPSPKTSDEMMEHVYIDLEKQVKETIG